MKNENQLKWMPGALTFVRVLIGWHFLYEGIVKLAVDGWSSSAYLVQSKWILSGFAGWILAHPTVLEIVDFLNSWGLVFIGAGLLLGFFTRIASIAGAFLLLVYYVTVPPFIIPPGNGHYLFINNQIIEAGVLVVYVLLKKDYTWGIDRLVKQSLLKRKEEKFPSNANHKILATDKNRREFIKNLAVLPVFGAAFFGMAKKTGWLSYEEENLKKTDAISSASLLNREDYDLTKLKGKVPAGKIKNVEISRMIPGGNLVAGFAHARDLVYVSKWIKQYHSDEKVIETLWKYQDVGINTVIMRTDEQTIRILNKFRKRWGDIQWLAQTYPNEKDLSNIKLAVDNGAIGAFVMGNIADKLVYNNKMEFIDAPVNYIRSQGLIAGVAGHAVATPKQCIENGIKPDFFMKTMHHDNYWSAHPKENRQEFIVNATGSNDHDQQHDNIWCVDANETSDFFKNLDIPWIAYKVLAAGAIKPEDGFKYAFNNGADFICVGMFDFQVIENANVVHNTLNNGLTRHRRWYS